MFKVGDKVRLKKEWYKEDVCRVAQRKHRKEWAKNIGYELQVYCTDNCFACYGRTYPAIGTKDNKGCIVIPIQLLELVELKTEVKAKTEYNPKLCRDCEYFKIPVTVKPCNRCFQKSKWTAKAPVFKEQPKPEVKPDPKAGDIIEHEGKKYRLVERKAKTGDLVSVNYETDRFKKGDIFKVTGVFTSHYDGEWAEYGNGRHYGKFFYEHQYLVLEPIMHEWTKAEIDEANRIIGEIMTDFATHPDKRLAVDATKYLKTNTIKARLNGGKVYESKPIGTDTPNASIGMCVAMCKAIGRKIPSFIKGDGK